MGGPSYRTWVPTGEDGEERRMVVDAGATWGGGVAARKEVGEGAGNSHADSPVAVLYQYGYPEDSSIYCTQGCGGCGGGGCV